MATIQKLSEEAAPGPAPPPREGASPTVLAALVTVAGAAVVLVLSDLLVDWNRYDKLSAATVIAGTLLAVFAAPRRYAPWIAGALVAAWFAGHGLYELTRDSAWGLSVSNSVSGGAYFRSGYLASQAASAVLLAVPYAVALAITVLRGRAPAASVPAPRTWSRDGVILAGVTALIAFTTVPDLWEGLSGAALAPVNEQWDTGNLLTWDALMERGLEPVKDFFYPYGELLSFQATPWGPMYQWFATCGLLFVVAWALFRLTGGGVVRSALGVLAVAVVLTQSMFFVRYFPGLVIGVVYAALGPLAHRRPTLGHAVLALTILYAGWLEADLIILGGAAMACVLAGELVAGRVRTPLLELVRRLVVDFAPFLVFGLVIVWWAATGTLDENLRFFTQLRAVSAASAPEEKTIGALAGHDFVPSFGMVSLLTPALLLIAGLVLGRLRGPRAYASSLLLLVGAGVTEVMLLKSLVRPAPDIVVLPAMVILLFAALTLWDRRSLVVAGAIGAFGAIAFTLFQGQLLWVSNYVVDASDSPDRVRDDVGVRSRYKDVRVAEDARFSAWRFGAWPETTVAKWLTAEMQRAGGGEFAVVGDSPLLYLLMRQDPPYHIQLYDASRIGEQRVYVEDLERRHPRFIVYRRDVFQDAVPQAVRVPLIFDYMIRNYVPVRTSKAFDILEARGSKPVDEVYWRSRLSATDLGWVPSLSRAASAPSCDSGPDCVQYAMVEGHTNAADELVKVRVTGPDGNFFYFTLHGGKDKTRYPVRLDRLWFSSFVGPAPKLEIESRGGWTVKREGHRTGDALY